MEASNESFETRAPSGVRVRDGAEGLAIEVTWRTASAGRNAALALAATTTFLTGVASLLVELVASPIRAGVCFVAMWWPVAHLVNRTRVDAGAKTFTFAQRPIPLMGAREYERKSVASFRADGRDVRVQLASGETERCTRVPTEQQALFVANALNAHLAAR